MRGLAWRARRSALGSAGVTGVCYPKDPTSRIPQVSGSELLQEVWPNESFFLSVLVSATQALGRIQTVDPPYGFYNLRHPRSRVRLVATEGVVKRTLCVLVSAIQTHLFTPPEQ